MDSERLVLFAIPFHGVRRRGTTEKANFSLMNVNSCVALVEEHFGSRFIIHPADLKSKEEYRREKSRKIGIRTTEKCFMVRIYFRCNMVTQ
jgi:hypothetical protein